mmetsp:Transcript_79364/g.220837  ORF Transcript_79364/g.220837 Transcript_79364/m.220837 type:complete len:307 (+) Transcript_79364:80-1000(+)
MAMACRGDTRSSEPGAGGLDIDSGSFAAALEDRDRRIAELEATVAHQRARIEKLEGSPSGPIRGSAVDTGEGGEIDELRAIVEAQEAALNDQRRIIESQGGLLEELNAALQAQFASHAEQPSTLDAMDESPPTPSGRGAPSSSRQGGQVPMPLRSGAPGIASVPGVANSGMLQQQQQPLSARGRREQVSVRLSQHQQRLQQGHRTEVPRPRPNSMCRSETALAPVLPRGSGGGHQSRSAPTPGISAISQETTPRSHGDRRRGSGSASNPNGRRSPMDAHGRAGGAGLRKDGGSSLPPALPLLRQEA